MDPASKQGAGSIWLSYHDPGNKITLTPIMSSKALIIGWSHLSWMNHGPWVMHSHTTRDPQESYLDWQFNYYILTTTYYQPVWEFGCPRLFIYCRILIGAPDDESPLATSNSLSRPGSVYRCTSRPPFQCSVIPFDNTGNNNVSGSAIDEKSHQWFGASISSSGIDGYVVVRQISE